MLLAGILLSAIFGNGWTATLAPVAYTVGALLIALGLGRLLAGGGSLVRVSQPSPS